MRTIMEILEEHELHDGGFILHRIHNSELVVVFAGELEEAYQVARSITNIDVGAGEEPPLFVLYAPDDIWWMPSVDDCEDWGLECRGGGTWSVV